MAVEGGGRGPAGGKGGLYRARALAGGMYSSRTTVKARRGAVCERVLFCPKQK